jgi:tetratricopeptide (TPR) repeat protein
LGKRVEAEDYFDKFVAIDGTVNALTSVAGFYYYSFGVFDNYGQEKARKYLNKAYSLDPNDFETLHLLGCGFANNPPDRKKALLYLEKAYSLGFRHPDIIISLANISIFYKNYAKAEDYLKSGLSSDSENVFFVWAQLISLLAQNKNIVEAKKYFELALKKYPNNQSIIDLQSAYFEKEDNITKPKVNLFTFLDLKQTQENYQSIAKIISNSNIKHVAMQYPRRDISMLRNVLKSFPNILFVENKNNFEKYLISNSYDELFIDRFGGDFGHFTLLGSQIIANQLVDSMKENKLIEPPIN